MFPISIIRWEYLLENKNHKKYLKKFRNLQSDISFYLEDFNKKVEKSIKLNLLL